MRKLLIVTTVPMTLDLILKNQPKFLSSNFDVYLASSNGPAIARVEMNESLPVNVVPMVRGINPVYDIYSIYKMVKLILEIKPEIVHSYTPKAGLVAMLSAMLCRIPIRIHTFTGLIFPSAKGFKRLLLSFIDRCICFFATKIVPEGKGVMNDLISNSITNKPLSVIGFGNIAGVDTSYFAKHVAISEVEKVSLCKKLGIEEDAFVFCFVGRLTADKGLCELANAFERLPVNATLLIVGASDERQPLPSGILTKLEESPRVCLLGHQSDIRPFLAVSNVLVLPSYREGFPNVPLQAGAMGLPCIVSNINGCNEIIQDGYNGWLVEPKNEENLYEVMLNSMTSTELVQFGENARDNVKAKFEKAEHWKRMLDFYNSEILN